MFRVRSMSFPWRSPEDVRRLFGTRRPVYSRPGTSGFPAHPSGPKTFATDGHPPNRRNRPQGLTLFLNLAELSNQC